MPHYSADSADDSVAAQAYEAASKLTNNTTILLALFEAGMVESNFHNNTHATDHDSVGYLQQRPSQGWKNPTDVAVATKSFIAKAKRVLAENPHYTAAQLAQGVQVSQYPQRYGQAAAAAQRLLTDASAGKLGTPTPIPTPGASGGSSSGRPSPTSSGEEPATGANQGDTGSGGGGLFGGIADAITGAFKPLLSVGHVADQIFKFFMPSNLIRTAALIMGTFFIFYGVVLLAREMRNK